MYMLNVYIHVHLLLEDVMLGMMKVSKVCAILSSLLLIGEIVASFFSDA